MYNEIVWSETVSSYEIHYMTTKPDFVWYAAHPELGELIIHCKPGGDKALIYCVRMLRERLGPKPNAVQTMELGLGPCGTVPRHLYMECGVVVSLPFKLRMIVLVEARRLHEEGIEEMTPAHDEELSRYMVAVFNSHLDLPA